MGDKMLIYFRCKACDKELSDWESKQKNTVSGEYEDLCNPCINAGRNSWHDLEEAEFEEIEKEFWNDGLEDL